VKKVEVILDPEKLDEVRALLRRIGVDGMTVTDVRRFGSDLDHSEFYRGAEHRVYHLWRSSSKTAASPRCWNSSSAPPAAGGLPTTRSSC
jgi:nitrogen regulatory protein PII